MGRRAKRNVILSLGLVLLVLGAFEIAFRASPLAQSFEGESLYAVKAAELSSLKELDLAFTGDARILHGIDPRAVQAAIKAERSDDLYVYNAGLPRAAPMAQLAIVRRLLSRSQQPRLVVMAVSPHMFASRVDAETARESLAALFRLRDVRAAARAGAVVEGQEVAVARGTTNEGLQEAVLDTRDVRGRSAVLAIRDQGSGAFEHINVDHVAICP